MSEIARVVAFLDACVLYPALLRNFLMHLALRDLFQARWSDRVHEEWIAVLLHNRPDLTFAQLARTRRLMDQNIDEALVSGYEHLIDRITLPDPKDRHVLAAAIHGGASIIVTVNLRDFPPEVLATYGSSNGWLDGKPAAITRKVGNGRITYIGAWLDNEGMAAAAKWMADVSGVKPALGPVPDGVEVNPRYGSKGTVYILVNLSKAEQTVALPSKMADVLEGGAKSSLTLPRYGVAVLSAARP